MEFQPHRLAAALAALALTACATADTNRPTGPTQL